MLLVLYEPYCTDVVCCVYVFCVVCVCFYCDCVCVQHFIVPPSVSPCSGTELSMYPHEIDPKDLVKGEMSGCVPMFCVDVLYSGLYSIYYACTYVPVHIRQHSSAVYVGMAVVVCML